jgi:hypothetical protein
VKLKPHASLTGTLLVLVKVSIAISAIAVLAGFYELYSYSTLPAHIDPNETLLASDVVTSIVGIVQFALLIVTFITLLRWIYRSTKNLRALSGESMAFTPGWSVGWFFIPIANLVKPYQVMKEIWNASHKDEAAGHSIVGWWWGLWLASSFIANIAPRLLLGAGDARGYAASSAAYIISDGLDVVVYTVMLIMISRIGAAYARNIVEPEAEASGFPLRLHPDSRKIPMAAGRIESRHDDRSRKK